MAYTVYIHTTPNGKKYVGITSQPVSKRWQNGLGYKKSPRFYNAILKYGWENITHEIIFSELTKDQAEEAEIQLIKEYRANDKRFGYNISNGGNSIGTLSEETKLKLSIKHRGKKISQSTRNKLSQIHKKENLSDETLDKMRYSHIGKKLSEETKNKIGDKHRGKINSAKVIEKMIQAKKHKAKPFIQYTLDGDFVKQWASASEYERQTGKNKRHISRCLKGEIKSAYGYVWKYMERL